MDWVVLVSVDMYKVEGYRGVSDDPSRLPKNVGLADM